jgi:hypothetical protein
LTFLKLYQKNKNPRKQNLADKLKKGFPKGTPFAVVFVVNDEGLFSVSDGNTAAASSSLEIFKTLYDNHGRVLQ